MKRIALSCAMLLSISVQAQPINEQLKPVKNFAFKRGEVLTYRVHYGLVDAGEATVSISQEATKFQDKPTYHVVGTGKSSGGFDWFFKVRDRYDSFIDEETLLPQFFLRKVDEGGFIINQNYLFNQKQNYVTVGRDGTDKPKNTSNKKFDIPAYTHDILSAFYFARNADLGLVKPGDMITVQTFFDEELFPLQVKVIGRETIKTRAGKIRCVKLRPIIQQGRVFKEEEDLTLWISDDLNRIPVRLQADVLVGSIKMDLKEYKGLANQLNIEK
jgi:hypothetical protein